MPSPLLTQHRLSLQLGAGGMATVHLAAHTDGKCVALKRMHNHLAVDPDMRQLFAKEARLQSLVAAPNVCGLLAFDTGRWPWISLEYVRGVSLLELRANLAAEPSCDFSWMVAFDALCAVKAVHESRESDGRPAGIVHGDIAADNVIVSYDGLGKLFDFGVASSARMKQVGSERGRASYLSPERLEGARFDQRADQWSAAVLIYELLTGQHPFRRASELSTFHAIADARFDPPSTVVPAPRQASLKKVDAPIARALSRDPSNRYPDVASFGEAMFGGWAPTLKERQQLGAWMDLQYSARKVRLIDAEREAVAAF